MRAKAMRRPFVLFGGVAVVTALAVAPASAASHKSDPVPSMAAGGISVLPDGGSISPNGEGGAIVRITAAPAGTKLCAWADFAVNDATVGGFVPFVFKRVDFTPNHPTGIALAVDQAPAKGTVFPAQTIGLLHIDVCLFLKRPTAGGTISFIPVLGGVKT